MKYKANLSYKLEKTDQTSQNLLNAIFWQAIFYLFKCLGMLLSQCEKIRDAKRTPRYLVKT